MVGSGNSSTSDLQQSHWFNFKVYDRKNLSINNQHNMLCDTIHDCLQQCSGPLNTEEVCCFLFWLMMAFSLQMWDCAHACVKLNYFNNQSRLISEFYLLRDKSHVIPCSTSSWDLDFQLSMRLLFSPRLPFVSMNEQLELIICFSGLRTWYQNQWRGVPPITNVR